jgi:putative membrane protein
MKFVITILLNAAAVYLTAELLQQISLPDFTTALLVALVLGVINITIKPLIKLLTLPLNILTLGLLGFAINGGFLYLATYLVEGFMIASFWWAILASLLITFLTSLFSTIIGFND